MPGHNVNLTPDLDDFVLTRVEGGRYANVSELVQAALSALDREEQTHDRKRKESVAGNEGDVGKNIEADLHRKLWHTQIGIQANQ